ncbi:hypothetical protein AYO38_04830 [bacterium SCGC AG-212-C10]|nr:hypothetical protein AYO38_04830 [bacterium SCGC AG-212-C10]
MPRRVYSERLGEIGHDQFEAAVQRLGLGRFLGAEPITSGLFGQNVFVTTSEGKFVLRGAPHWVKGAGDEEYYQEDRWQFTKERYFAQQLHEHTNTPVPWPMLHDQSNDIFGWPYLIMPRMPGVSLDERTVLRELAPADRRSVAAALGRNLAEMQRLTSPIAGDFGVESIALEEYPEGAVGSIAREADTFVQACGDRITLDEATWIAAAAAVAGGDGLITYVHCDYKLGNLTLLHDGGEWRVSGLFDFHEARFADGALDIVRVACGYLDSEPDMARIFLDAYGKGIDPAHLTLYVLNDRLKIWSWFTHPDHADPRLKGLTFRRWAQRYIDGLLALI